METTKINKILHVYKVSALAAMAHATNDIKPRKLRFLDPSSKAIDYTSKIAFYISK